MWISTLIITYLKEQSAQLGQLLTQRHWQLATAESCTGGLVAAAITAIPGSSDWFERGWVTYSNRAKQEMLGVKAWTLEHEGAVSEATAREMAEGAILHSTADISVAVTGIAGPEGGTLQKPVGTVWFAWAIRSCETKAQVHHFTGDRHEIRLASVKTALEGLIQRCLS